MGDPDDPKLNESSPSRETTQTTPNKLGKPRRKAVAKAPLDPCTFCSLHPVGKVAAAIRPCDSFGTNRDIVECTNCANHRRAVADPTFSCIIPPSALIGLRRYADEDPISYGSATCEACAGDPSKRACCDVDPLLMIACSRCKKQECVLDDRLMTPRPNVPATQRAWFRHSCTTCHRNRQGKVSSVTSCSWLHNRDSWHRACDQCADLNTLCLDGGLAVEYPTVRPPTSWLVSAQESRYLVPANQTGPWRKRCQSCEKQGETCFPSASAPLNACNRCEARGTDCISPDGMLYPIFDLSAVGFGRSNYFEACDQCLEKGRNCDRQRPCDSCVNHGDHESCKEVNKGCFKDRFSTHPGPLYYLALGYGALGVDDVKDGTRLEHWIGPPWPPYSSKADGKAGPQSLTMRVIQARKLFLPDGPPPHGGPDGQLTHLQPSRMTVNDLLNALAAQWPGIKPPREHIEGFDERVKSRKNLVHRPLDKPDSRTEQCAATITSLATPSATPELEANSAGFPTPTPEPSIPINRQLSEAMEGVVQHRRWTEADWDAWEASLTQYEWYADAPVFDFHALPSAPVPEIAPQRSVLQRPPPLQHAPPQAYHPSVFVSESSHPVIGEAARPNTRRLPHHEQQEQKVDNQPSSMKVSQVIEYPGPPGKATRLPRSQRVRIDRDPAIFEDHKYTNRILTFSGHWMYHNWRWNHPDDVKSMYDDEEARELAEMFMTYNPSDEPGLSETHDEEEQVATMQASAEGTD